MGFANERVTIHGETLTCAVIGGSSARSLRHLCPTWGTPVLGVRDPDDRTLTRYAGTLDDPELFAPREANFDRSRRSRDHGTAPLPEFEALP